MYRASLERSEREDDTGDIKHLILKVSLVKGLGGLSLVCFVRRVYFGAVIWLPFYLSLSTGTCQTWFSQTSLQLKCFVCLRKTGSIVVSDSQVLKSLCGRSQYLLLGKISLFPIIYRDTFLATVYTCSLVYVIHQLCPTYRPHLWFLG